MIPPTTSTSPDGKSATAEEVTGDWLGEARVLGITAGASTPNNKVGETVIRIAAVAGLDLDSLLSPGGD